MISVIIAGAGSGSRSKLDKNKLLFASDGQTVIETTVRAFLPVNEVGQIIVTASVRDQKQFAAILCPLSDKIKVVLGGDTRTRSVKNALEFVSGDITLIHDGARPKVSISLIERVIEKARANGSAIPVLPSTDTLGVGVGRIESVGRENIYRIHTPQAFRTDLIKKAYSLIADGDSFTDDSGVYCKYIGPCEIVDGDRENVKLTYPEDFGKFPFAIGTGFDLHQLVEGRKLILGGVEIPHHKGLLGHSDADVLTHAVMDALLSSVGERDIGYHFPDTDPKYKGADSIKLLRKVMSIVASHGKKPVSVTAVIMAEKPKLMKFVPQITQNLAKELGLPEKDVGITCTTLEGLGIIGEERAIAVRCNLLVTDK